MATFFSAEYAKVARALKDTKPPLIFNAELTQHFKDCCTLASMFAEDNKNFNRNTFMLACGYDGHSRNP